MTACLSALRLPVHTILVMIGDGAVVVAVVTTVAAVVAVVVVLVMAVVTTVVMAVVMAVMVMVAMNQNQTLHDHHH